MDIWSGTSMHEKRWCGAVMPVEGAGIPQVHKDLFQKFGSPGLLLYHDAHCSLHRGMEGRTMLKTPEHPITDHPTLKHLASYTEMTSLFSRQWTKRSRCRKEAATLETNKWNENICKHTLFPLHSSSLETAWACGPLISAFIVIYILLHKLSLRSSHPQNLFPD